MDWNEKEKWAGVLARIRRRTRSAEDAEDLLHSAWLRLFAYRAENEVREPVAFLVQTAARLSVDQYRQNRRFRAEPLESYGATLQDDRPLQTAPGGEHEARGDDDHALRAGAETDVAAQPEGLGLRPCVRAWPLSPTLRGGERNALQYLDVTVGYP